MDSGTAGGRIACFGEPLVRLCTRPGDRGIAHADALDMHVGGAECNVAVALAMLGHRATMITAVPDGLLGERVIAHLRSAGVDADRILRAAGRQGLYFVEAGASLSPTRVLYDRADSLFATTDWLGHDWDAALADARLLHVSGISLAVSDGARAGTLAAMGRARARGITVSLDGNFRAQLWDGREADWGRCLGEALALADLAFVDSRDGAAVLGRDLPADGFAGALFDVFPRLGLIAHTTRAAESVEDHWLSAHVMVREGHGSASAARRIPGIVDRIGGGDAFAAGVLHAWLGGADVDRLAAFGLAAACLKHAQRGDALMASGDQIAQLLHGQVGIRR